MNQWTNPEEGNRTSASAPWEQTQETGKKKTREKKTRAVGTGVIIALIVLLIAAFACGFGAVYGANRLAENYAYLFEKPSNPTFSRPRDRDTQELPPVDPPMEQTPQDEPNDPVELPDEPIPEIPQTETGTFAEQGNVVFPVLDAPRIKLESSAGLRKMSVADIAEKLSPSVVSIVAYLSDSDQEGYFLGTGTIYSSDGYIITNYHVIEEAVRVKVLLSDGTEYAASHISSDETADIAILKIDAQGLRPLPFGRSSDLRIGDEVTAIGCPATIELAGTTTSGRITGPERYLPMDSAGNIMRLLQTDASVNPGNSGGPLINAYGQVIGIVTAKLTAQTYEGIGFAISSDRLEHIVSDLLQYGYVTGYPMLGFTGSTVSAGKVDGSNPEGVLVAEVSASSNASGLLEAGDVVFSVNGETVYSIPDINAIKGKLEVGDTMRLGVYREGKTFEVDIVLKDRHDVD